MKVPYGRYEGQPLNVVPTRALKTIQHATCTIARGSFWPPWPPSWSVGSKARRQLPGKAPMSRGFIRRAASRF